MRFPNHKLYQEALSAAGGQEKKMNTADIKSGSTEASQDLQKLKNDLGELQKIKLSKESADDMLERVKTLKSSEKVVAQKLTTLDTGLRLIVDNPKDPKAHDIIMSDDREEIANLQEKILSLKQELNEIIESSGALQRTLETLKKNQLTPQEIEQFKTIKNIDFLKLSSDERLRYITVANIDAKQVSEGKQKNIEFTFTYDGVFNRDFYIRTTAGQVLPPEVRELTSGTEVFVRNGLNGEFFTASGKRLKIHEGTKVDISKLADTKELQTLQSSTTQEVQSYEGKQEYDMALEAEKRGIDPKFAILTFGDALKNVPQEQRKAWIEDKLTDIARFQDDFADEYPGEKSFEGGKVTEAFAGYLTNILKGNTQAMISAYSFNHEKFNAYKKEKRYTSGGPLKMENINIDGVSQAEIETVLKMKRFIPGSKEAIILFTVAAKAANFPADWGKSSELHRVLSRESNGQVGRLNYTIPKSMTSEEFKRVSLERGNNNPIGTVSTASGLGQLLLTNVDKYYPDGRRGIGDALNEAVGMLRYIHDRYGSPEVAGQVYGRVCSYTHALTGKYCEKKFKEGY